MTEEQLKRANTLNNEIKTIERLLDDCALSSNSISDWEQCFPKEMIERHRDEMLTWAEKRHAELKAQFEAL